MSIDIRCLLAKFIIAFGSNNMLISQPSLNIPPFHHFINRIFLDKNRVIYFNLNHFYKLILYLDKGNL